MYKVCVKWRNNANEVLAIWPLNNLQQAIDIPLTARHRKDFIKFLEEVH